MHEAKQQPRPRDRRPLVWWRRPRWRYALGGFLWGVAYTGFALLIGAQFTLGGRDLTTLAGAVIELSFATLGYGLGLVVEARRGERDTARALHRQLELLADTQRRLAQAEKLASLGQLAGAIAHEVRNPLAILRSLVQNLEESLCPPGPNAGAVDARIEGGRLAGESRIDAPRIDAPRATCAMLLEEIDRLAHVTTSLVEFARPPKLKRSPARAAELVERVVLLAGQMLRTSSVRLEIEAPDDRHDGGPMLDVDADLICQVLLELIENATELSAEEGTVRLSWQRASDGEIRFTVSDTGPGVAPELRRRIFDPFFTTRSGGAGLGLAVAKHVIEAHGGTIVVSDAEDAMVGGACFRVHLPASDAVPSAP